MTEDQASRSVSGGTACEVASALEYAAMPSAREPAYAPMIREVSSLAQTSA